MTQVILLADVDNLGLRGDLVDVAPGYARNFLLPRRLAETATPGRITQLRRHEELRARQEARTVEHARDIADTLAATELRFDVNAGPTGSLFGSVTATTIVDEIWATHRIRVDRRRVGLQEPIKRIGRYTVPIDIFEDVSVEVRTLVVPEGGELPPEEELAAAAAAEEAAAAEAAAAQEEAGMAVESLVEELEAEEADAPPEPEAEPRLSRRPTPRLSRRPTPRLSRRPRPRLNRRPRPRLNRRPRPRRSPNPSPPRTRSLHLRAPEGRPSALSTAFSTELWRAGTNFSLLARTSCTCRPPRWG